MDHQLEDGPIQFNSINLPLMDQLAGSSIQLNYLPIMDHQ